MLNQDWIGSKYCQKCSLLGRQFCKCNVGGLRNPPGGRPSLPIDQKRQKHSPTLAPGIKELAQQIAKNQGLPGWGHLIDQLVIKEAERLEIK